MLNLWKLGCLSSAVLAASLFAQSTKPMTNADVIEMVKAGLNESVITKTIQANDTDFDVSPQAVIELSKAGVAQSIIELMISETPRIEPYREEPIKSKKSPPLTTPSPSPVPTGTGNGTSPAKREPPPCDGESKAPQILSKVEPLYPEQARKNKVKGTVVLKLTVQADGSVGDIKVAQSVDGLLDQEAVKALSKWRFKPGMRCGKTADFSATVEMRFPAEPQPLQPKQYEAPTIGSVKGSLGLVNYSGLPDEPMLQLLDRARKEVNALPGIIVAVTPPGDDPVSFANPADTINECDLRACAKEEITKGREFATNGGYIVIRLVKQGSGAATAETFFRVAVHEFRHVKDFQDVKRRTGALDWSRSRKVPHDNRPEEIRANKTVEKVMAKLREHIDADWQGMIAELGSQMDHHLFGVASNARVNPPPTPGSVSRINFRLETGVTAPQVISKTDPEYSEQARKAKYQGWVILNMIVKSDGTVGDVKVVQSLGLGLDEKAVEAVKKWGFRPGLKNGVPVDVRATIEFTFRLL